MAKFEYKVVPAPKKPGKIKGVKGTDNRFAVALSTLMNEYGAQGWEYQRTDTLPCEERQGFTGRTTTFQNMLVFRREIEELAEDAAPVAAPALITHAPAEPAEPAALASEQIAPGPEPKPVPTFRSAAFSPVPNPGPNPAPNPASNDGPVAPKLTAVTEVPEGDAPPIAAQ